MRKRPGVDVDADELIRLRSAARGLRLNRRRRAATGPPGPQHSRLRGRGVDYLETRGYQPGDDIRHMDWRVTARTGEPHTKIYQQERERPVVLVVDANPSMFFGSRGAFKSVTAARAAALLGWAAVDAGDRIGGFFYGAARPGSDLPRHRELEPAGGPRGALRLIRELASWGQPPPADAASGEPGRLTTALRRLHRVARPGSLVVIISDFYTLADDEAAGRPLARLRQHNDILALQVSDALEYEPPPPGSYPVSDGRQLRQLEIGSAQAAAAYRAHFAAHHRRIRQCLRGRDIPLLSLRGDADAVAALRRGLEDIR